MFKDIFSALFYGSLTFFENILNKLVECNLEERSRVIGLPDKRVDNIVAGTVISLSVLKYFKKNLFFC